MTHEASEPLLLTLRVVSDRVCEQIFPPENYQTNNYTQSETELKKRQNIYTLILACVYTIVKLYDHFQLIPRSL